MIEPHPTEPSIIVNYKLEAAVYGDRDISMLTDKKVRVIFSKLMEETQQQQRHE